MFRHSTTGLLLLLALACAATAAPTTAPAPKPADIELGKKLSHKLPVVNAKSVRLGRFFDFVRGAGGVNVVVNWRELAKQKVDERLVVNYAARNVELGDMLRKVLEAVNPRISFDAGAGAVYVTSKLDLFAHAGQIRMTGDESEASARVNAALEQTVADVQLESVRLRTAFQLMQENLHVPLEVDWKALDDAGVADDELVTLHLRKPTGEQVLCWIIRPLPKNAPVVFAVREGKVVVTRGPGSFAKVEAPNKR